MFSTAEPNNTTRTYSGTPAPTAWPSPPAAAAVASPHRRCSQNSSVHAAANVTSTLGQARVRDPVLELVCRAIYARPAAARMRRTEKAFEMKFKILDEREDPNKVFARCALESDVYIHNLVIETTILYRNHTSYILHLVYLVKLFNFLLKLNLFNHYFFSVIFFCLNICSQVLYV